MTTKQPLPVIFSIPTTIYWWNLGKKQLDFTGTLWEYFQKIEVKITRVKHPKNKAIAGYKFKIPVGSYTCSLVTYSDAADAGREAAKVFLSLLGDKATLQTYGRFDRINWR